jgi:hypothetical protein
METKISKTIKYLILIGTVMLMSACSILGGGADEEVEALQEQINQMATQNALLLEQVEGSIEEDVQAPPPPDEDSTPQVSMATSTPESLPDQPVPAGVPIIYDGWSITVSKEIDVFGNGQFGLIIFVRNLGETKRTFRFMNASVLVKDNLGTIYEYVNNSTCEQIHYDVKNLEVNGEDSEKVYANEYSYNNRCGAVNGIDTFQGPIPIEAEQLIITFQDFGPFTGIEVVIDL